MPASANILAQMMTFRHFSGILTNSPNLDLKLYLLIFCAF